MEEKEKKKRGTAWWTMLIGGILMGVAGVVMLALPFVLPKEALPALSFPTIPSVTKNDVAYSDLTGLALSNAADKTAPTYCIQTPNGMDGARPQAGLDEAGVVFEAIAEAGITRFAAIYQKPESAVIGPIRSLRIYYLQWDVPFDCTIVHAGGAPDAIAAARKYKDLSENYTYMYRGSVASRRWNNLFTTGEKLAAMSAARGYNESRVNGFSRMTPDEATVSRVDEAAVRKLDITEPADGNTSELAAKVTGIAVKFGGLPNFNVKYTYNTATNSYDRAFESGAAHDVYDCPDENLGDINPESACTLKVLSPAVVVAMVVSEKRAAYDNYHEDITTLGSGEVNIFQNGIVMHGTWRKDSVESQIRFYDDSGVEIKLAPGQTFVEAVPQYGSVTYN